MRGCGPQHKAAARTQSRGVGCPPVCRGEQEAGVTCLAARVNIIDDPLAGDTAVRDP